MSGWLIILILALLGVFLIIFAIIVFALMIALWIVGGTAFVVGILMLIFKAFPIKLKPFEVTNVSDKKG